MFTAGYVGEFLHEERAKGKAAATLRNRERALRLLSEWMQEHGLQDKDVTRGHLVDFINGFVGRYTAEHINSIISSLRVYFRWLDEEGLLDGRSPAERLKFQRVAMQPVEALSADEARRLVDWTRTQAHRLRFGVYRSAVLAVLLLDTGLRVGEALNLTLGDLNFDGQRILVRKTKTKDFRVVPLKPDLRGHLRRYMRIRERYLLKRQLESEWLFISESGKQCGVSVAEHSFLTLGQRAGIRQIHPHLLRHTFATLMLTNGAAMQAVMRVGGWRKLSTVQRYTYMNDQLVAEIFEKTSPLANL